jgi:hypothetical protein
MDGGSERASEDERETLCKHTHTRTESLSHLHTRVGVGVWTETTQIEYDKAVDLRYLAPHERWPGQRSSRGAAAPH